MQIHSNTSAFVIKHQRSKYLFLEHQLTFGNQTPPNTVVKTKDTYDLDRIPNHPKKHILILLEPKTNSKIYPEQKNGWW